MAFSIVEKKQLNNCVDMVLHSKGNTVPENSILEMTIILDESLSKDYLKDVAKDIVATLKQHNKVFENVRNNIVYWKVNGDIKTEIVPMSFIILERLFNDDSISENTDITMNACNQNKATKDDMINNQKLENLYGYLKLFHARSKLIILITGEKFSIENNSLLKENINPFLKTKLIVINETEIKSGRNYGVV